ncbi:MAG: hypothetical protein ACT4N2_07850 [Hyphomicrobium sp.]
MSLSETYEQIMLADDFTIGVVWVLAAWSALLLKQMTESNVLALLLAPMAYFGALAGIFYCREWEFIFFSQKEANIVVAASLGTMVAVVVLLLVTRAVNTVIGRSRTGLEARIAEGAKATS